MRPIRHKCDETIRGHAFNSIRAIVLRKRLDAPTFALLESMQQHVVQRRQFAQGARGQGRLVLIDEFS